MNEFPDDNVSAVALLELWVQAYSEFWTKTLGAWAPGETTIPESLLPFQVSQGRFQESLETSLRILQEMVLSIQQPNTMEALFKSARTTPQVLAKAAGAVWESFFHLQKDWMERASRIGKSTTGYKFDNRDQEVFKAWQEVYEKEFSQFFQVPQLGLTRFYQERGNNVLDKFNILQAIMAEFSSLLYLPVEKSLCGMQAELSFMNDQGGLPDSSEDLYRIWIKSLEENYTTLFKSVDYSRCLARTIDAMSDFIVAKKEILQDALQVLPVPTNKEMDELYREIYQLKKMVKELAKQNRSIDSTIAMEERSRTSKMSINAVRPEILLDEISTSLGLTQ